MEKVTLLSQYSRCLRSSCSGRSCTSACDRQQLSDTCQGRIKECPRTALCSSSLPFLWKMPLLQQPDPRWWSQPASETGDRTSTWHPAAFQGFISNCWVFRHRQQRAPLNRTEQLPVSAAQQQSREPAKRCFRKNCFAERGKVGGRKYILIF